MKLKVVPRHYWEGILHDRGCVEVPVSVEPEEEGLLNDISHWESASGEPFVMHFEPDGSMDWAYFKTLRRKLGFF